MDPIAETREALEEFQHHSEDADLVADLQRSAELVRAIVPSCTGVSLALMAHGVTFTLAATSTQVAALDGMQYVDGGPCDDGAHEGRALEYNVGDPVDEARWAIFARSTAAENLASTLTLPIRDGERVVGSVNLYASDPHAFDDRHELVAAVFGAWAPGAVTNADLGFETRRAAQEAPSVVRSHASFHQAIGILASARGLSPESSRELIEQAALRAGVHLSEIARRIIDAFAEPER